jgi:hypothetical protein
MTVTSRRLFAVCSTVLFTTALAAQQTPVRDASVPAPRSGTAALSGVVVNDVTGQPLRRAVVTLSSSDGAVRLTAVTDDTGTFTFRNLPDDRYTLGAAKPAYVSVSHGSSRPGRPGSPIALAPGQQRTGVVLRLPPGAILTGTVRNRAGEAVPDARIQVLRQSFGYDSGEPSLSPVRTAGSPLGQATDNRGAYRIFGLPADDYFIVVTMGIGVGRGSELRETTAAEVEWAARQMQSPGSLGAAPLTPAPEPGRIVDYAPVFYPGAPTQAGAAMVRSRRRERGGVTFC